MKNSSEILLYTTPQGEVKIDVLYNDENIWLTQKKMATLFDVQIPAINKHLKNIFESSELDGKRVISILETTASDGKNYTTQFYNLDAIIAVGYLDYAELQASRQNLMRMQDWVLKLDAFLSFNDYNILEHAGKMSFEMAKLFAEEEFEKYRSIQDRFYESDFDKLI